MLIKIVFGVVALIASACVKSSNSDDSSPSPPTPPAAPASPPPTAPAPPPAPPPPAPTPTPASATPSTCTPGATTSTAIPGGTNVAFNQDIAPILQNRCADKCHGPSITQYANVKKYFSLIMDQVRQDLMPINKTIYWQIPMGQKQADPLTAQDKNALMSWAQQGFAECR